MRTAAFALIGLAMLAWVGLRLVEDRILFPAPPAPEGSPDPGASVQHAWLEIAGGRVEALLLSAVSPHAGPGPLLVYAHGNGELVDGWLEEFAAPRREGVSVLLVEYPGYGRSTGAAAEASIQQALAAGYDWAAAQPQVDPQRIIGHGRSLGGGAICALARVRSLAALILESTFTSVRDVAADRFGVPRFLVRDRFDNLAFVRTYASPVLVLHGESDVSIPVSQARRLAAAAPAATLELLPCGHNDCPRPWPAIEAFLRASHLL